jgi:hypothetical protein
VSNIVVIGALLITGVGALLAYGMKRLWPLLIPAPIALAALAWHWWEFSDEAAPFAILILVLGYLGVAIGAVLQRGRRRSKRDAL